MNTFNLICFLLFGFSTTFAGENYFIENNNTFYSINGDENIDVIFVSHYKDGAIYLRYGGFSIVSKDISYDDYDIRNTKYEYHRIDFEFDAMNPNRVIRTQKPHKTNEFVFRDNQRKELKAYSEIIYENLYPNIDLKFYHTDDAQPEFDFIVKPGANPKQIKMLLKYANFTFLDENGDLILGTNIREVDVSAPVSFVDNVKIDSRYNLKNNILSFEIDDYDKSKTLIIDPITRLWGSYYGSSLNETAYDIDHDSQGNYYICGLSESPTGIASGGYQVIFGGMEDAYLVKFNSNNNRLWSTYYGDDNFEVAYALSVDSDDNVILVGETSSAQNISSPTAHQLVYGGGSADGFIVKFQANGNRLWATYYGGLEEDKINDVVIDSFGNIYFVGHTDSFDNIFWNGFQPLIGGLSDAFFVKFNPLGDIAWGTYYGGGQNDYGTGIALDENRNVYIVGITYSLDNISFQGYQNSLGGGADAFFAGFTNDCDRLWASYFGGSDDDFGNSISITGEDLYISGSTKSTNNISFNGYQADNGGSWDGFLARFNVMGGQSWGTYLGGQQDDFLSYVHASGSNVYILGNTNSTNNISVEAYQDKFAGGVSDGLFSKFNKDGDILWSSYYGGEKRDELRSLSLNGDMFIAGFTDSETGIYDSGYQSQLAGGRDAMFARMTESQLNVIVDSAYCAGDVYSVSISVDGFVFGAGNQFIVEISDQNGSFASPNEVGRISSQNDISLDIELPKNLDFSKEYRFRVKSTNPSITGGSNRSSTTILPELSIITLPETVCQNQTRTYFVPNYELANYIWNIENGTLVNGDLDGNQIEVIWDSLGLSKISVIRRTDFGCEHSREIEFNVNELPNSEFSGETQVCPLQLYEYTAVQNGDLEYLWEVENGIVIGGSDTLRTLRVIWSEQFDNASVQLTIINKETECSNSTLKEILIKAKPNSGIIGVDESCKNCTESFSASGNNLEYIWSIQGGSLLSSPNSKEVSIRFDNVNEATLTLQVTDLVTFCVDSNSLSIRLSDNPKVIVSGAEITCEFNQYIYNTSTNPDLEHNWSVIGGEIIEENSSAVTIEWGEKGLGGIKLVQLNTETQFLDSTTKTIDIRPLPTIDINSFGNKYCVGQEVVFNPPGNFAYFYINSEFSSSNNSMVLDKIGEFEAYMVAVSKDNCIDSVLYNFEVFDTPPIPTIKQVGLQLISEVIGEKYQWYREGNFVKETNDNTFSPEAEGKYSVTVFNGNCWSALSEEINFSLNSIELITDGLQIYPNPVIDKLNVISDKMILSIEVINNLGDAVIDYEYPKNGTIDLSMLINGFYIIKLRFEDSILTRKIIVNK